MATYSHSKLSHDTDRLIAAEGLARILSKRTGIAYAAGMWQYQLPRQLLWQKLGFEWGDNKSSAGKRYVAPSW